MRPSNYLYPKVPQVVRHKIYPSIWTVTDHLYFWVNLIYKVKPHLYHQLRSMYSDSEVVLTNSGRSALLLGLKVLGIRTGDQVILSNFNCPAVIDAILTAGAQPVLVDTNCDFSLSFEQVQSHYNSCTRAILLTHAYGTPEDMRIVSWARERGVYIIDDAAQAMFSKQNGSFMGSRGDLGILSFGPTKPLSSIGGGALILNSREILCEEYVSMERKETVISDYMNDFKTQFSMNLTKGYIGRWLRSKLGLVPRYKESKLEVLPTQIDDIRIMGMSSLRASLIGKQFKRMALIVDRNHSNALLLRSLLEDLQHQCGVILFPFDQGTRLNYFTIILPEEEDRYELSVFLADKGIQTCWNYLPLNEIPLYAEFADTTENIDYLWKRVLSLPFKYPLGEEDIQYIASQVLRFFERKP